jgi:hypothetical protein
LDSFLYLVSEKGKFWKEKLECKAFSPEADLPLAEALPLVNLKVDTPKVSSDRRGSMNLITTLTSMKYPYFLKPKNFVEVLTHF